jgi:ribosomal-protein-alanine N-acetyltransferase
MAFLSFLRFGSDLHLEGAEIYLRPPKLSDYGAWSSLRENSRAFLTPWEPVWPADDLTRFAYRRRLARYRREIRHERAFPFFIFRKADHALLGGCTLSQLQRGVQQSALLGYWAGEAHAGKGYVTAGVKAVVSFAFDELGLHRVQAACVTDNERSKSVLRKCGFHEEGIARGFLKINGNWRDHQVFAILRDDPRG